MPQKTWYDFYKNRMNQSYRNHLAVKYRVFLDFIRERIIKNDADKIHESGCGCANMSYALKEYEDFITISDISADMLGLAADNVKCRKFLRDARKDNFPAVQIMYSHGLLEHFNDKDIISIVGNQMLYTKELIHYVPGSKYKTPSFGDERLLKKEYWQNLCAPDKIIEFNNGYDLILYWKSKL